jgi:hypothetical protein
MRKRSVLAALAIALACIGVATAHALPSGPGPAGAATLSQAGALPTLQSVRLSCADSVFASEQICNTAGQCVTASYSCFPYRCDSATKGCIRTCTSNAGCSGGFACREGQCVVPVPHGGGDVSQGASGAYVCNPSGACLPVVR